MSQAVESQIDSLLASFSHLVDSHIAEVSADLRQIGLILDEAIIKLDHSFYAINDQLAAHGSDLTAQEMSDSLTPHLNQAITGLQFHDLTSQLLFCAATRLDGLREIIQHSKSLGADGEVDLAQRLLEADQNLLTLSHNLHHSFTQSLRQQHMESGDVELF
jgi:hypothetical protein